MYPVLQALTVKVGNVKRNTPASRAGLWKMDYLISVIYQCLHYFEKVILYKIKRRYQFPNLPNTLPQWMEFIPRNSEVYVICSLITRLLHRLKEL